MAHAASGGRVAGIVCIDGFTLDSSDRVATASREVSSDATRAMLFDMFRYGWRATTAERDAYVDEVVAAAQGDWLNDGIDSKLLTEMLARCFVTDGDRWLRRPTLDEIATVSAPSPDALIFPSSAIYELIDVPTLLVWANGGLSAGRHEEVQCIATAAVSRFLVEVDGSHNLPMQRPVELAKIVAAFLERDACS